MHHSQMNSEVRRLIADGPVLPAHPLALDAARALDPVHQRALPRYYIDADGEAVAREIPLVGFYLQPAVGGVILSADFWRRFAAIDNVIAIKIAPFNRYRTLDVLRGVCAAGALDRIALYTGNDDHILLDLTLPFDLRDHGITTRIYFRGGLLGHWSVWTASAIKPFEMCRAAQQKNTLP